jgi:hypothetical protein
MWAAIFHYQIIIKINAVINIVAIGMRGAPRFQLYGISSEIL